jgi:hypothetical protein
LCRTTPALENVASKRFLREGEGERGRERKRERESENTSALAGFDERSWRCTVLAGIPPGMQRK